ncbi:hypothetical protein [Pseudomonas sp. NPDC087626]|uniref:hypothetical protein n=1 Tax=Pseudomonas sp. NPDC087626 TaxID=3364444 RepID=UPI003809D148
MRYVYWLLGIALCLGAAASAGLAAGITLNPDSTVRFVFIWGDSNAWAMWGTWAGAVFTAGAVWLSLYYSRHDDKEKLTLISEVHQVADGASTMTAKVTFRVVCTGRLPTTILAIGIGVANDKATFYPVARYTTTYDTRKHLSRGEIFEATLDVQSLISIASDFKPLVGNRARRLRFLVKTGLTSYREKFSPEAIAVLSLALSAS